MSHKQPALEKQLRLAMNKTFCNLRSNSTVVAIEEDEEFVYVEYRDENGQTRKVRAKFLVGADGKTGFTRKKYLEPRGVVMEKSREYIITVLIGCLELINVAFITRRSGLL